MKLFSDDFPFIPRYETACSTPWQNHFDRQPRGSDLDIIMNNILLSRDSFLLLLVVILAGYYILRLSSGSETNFFIVSSLSVNEASDTNILVDTSWHPPILSRINSLTSAINDTGTYGFVFNSSTLPEEIPYGIAIFFLLQISVAHI